MVVAFKIKLIAILCAKFELKMSSWKVLEAKEITFFEHSTAIFSKNQCALKQSFVAKYFISHHFSSEYDMKWEKRG